ncbi:hypothetical protein [Mycolicibacterium sp. CBMA 234]|uniref:hypothetical protein n=1 Tax=Mycolicibacterium sp. CBMA 234 TaxID=1918495 RepID=UPI0012DD7500|nr:hypothetical protein [Mycolicibacterium sp. CBMA 234]
MRRVAALAVAAALLSACSQTVSGQAAAPADLKWQRSITDSVSSLGGTLGTVGEAMTVHDFAAMSRDCTKLQGTLDDLSKNLPTPKDDVNASLQDSIDNFRAFARVCRTLTPGTADASLDQLSSYLDRGDSSMRKALQQMGIELPAAGH